MNWRAAGAIAALALCAVSAQAQSSCERFRDRLAERMNAAARGYTLEIVPGSTPLPEGAKVVGTCEGGARKVLFLRIGSPIAGVDAGADAGSAPRVRPAVAAAASVPPADAAPRTTTKALERGQQAASAANVGVKEERIESPEPARVGTAGSVTSSESLPTVAAVTRDAPSERPASAPSGPSNAPALEWLRRHLWWVAVPAGLLLAVPLWLWIAYRRAYDEHGLPRGPKLRA